MKKLKISKLLKSKKGALKVQIIVFAIIGVILLVILFEVYSAVIPTAQAAGAKLNASNSCTTLGCFYNATDSPNASITGIKCLASQPEVNSTCATQPIPVPLAGLFGAQGIVFVVIMAALLVTVVVAYLKFKKV